jgi:3D (Asp-Asp-Asp) domain-containing protein
MLLAEQYKSWVLPSLLEVPAWNEYIDALLEEIIRLQMYNMGSYNEWGFNGVEESISLENENDWLIGKEYFKTKGTIDPGGHFTIDNGSLIYSGGTGSVDSFSVIPYMFVLERKYKVTFEIYDLLPGIGLELNVGIGDNVETITFNLGMDDPYLVELELTADDYYMFFNVAKEADSGSFKIRNLKVVGVLDSRDEKERILVLKRIVNVDKASREVLERMRDSLSFPSIAGMPESLLRQIIKDYNKFIGYGGSELAASMFFYFLGYEVDFVHLYAAKIDYSSRQYSYIAQKEDDILESVPGTKVYGQVEETSIASYKMTLKDGHQVIAGDFVSNQTAPFNPVLIEVLSVEGKVITLTERVTVTEDDYIDIYRKYPYAVNPDPDNYMKTSHIDVFFKQKYLSGVNLDFAKLEQFFLKYLPINVVIRFFGYKTEPEDELFSFREAAFRYNPINQEDILFEELINHPTDNHAFVVQNPTPFTHVDIYGNNMDGYSFLCSHIDPGSGEPVYLIVPLT